MPARPVSGLWRHFERRAGGNSAVCKVENCQVLKQKKKPEIPCRDSNTSGLWSHLKRHHPVIFDELRLEKESENKRKKETDLVQPPITESLKKVHPKYGKTNPVQKKLHQNILNLMVFEAMPFKMVSSQHFKKLIADLDPRARPLHRTNYSRRIRKTGKFLKKKVAAEVKSRVQYSLGMTADAWESRAQEDFIGATVHLINENFELERLTLSCRPFEERHLGENIKEVLVEEMDKIKLGENHLKVLVTDAASNMRNARRIDGVKVMNCSNHQLQLCIKDALDPRKSPSNQDLHDAVEAATKLSNFARKSRYLHLTMKRKKTCKQAGHSFSKLKGVSKVRWNSMYQMIKAVSKHQLCINMIAADELVPNMPTIEVGHWKLLKNLIAVLEPLEHTTKIWESEKQPTMSRLAEEAYNLSEKLEAMIQKDDQRWRNTSDITRGPALRFAMELQRRISERFPNYGLEDDLVAWGHLLNPKCKGILLKEGNLMERTIRSISALIEKLMGIDEDEATTDLAPPDEHRPEQRREVQAEQETPMEALKRRTASTFQPRSPSYEDVTVETKVRRELLVYDKLKEPQRDEDCLKFWKDNRHGMPLLSIAARAVLAIPCASSSCERVFSIGTKCVAADRARLAPKTVEAIVMFKSNEGKVDMANFDEEEFSSDDEEAIDDSDSDTDLEEVAAQDDNENEEEEQLLEEDVISTRTDLPVPPITIEEERPRSRLANNNNQQPPAKKRKTTGDLPRGTRLLSDFYSPQDRAATGQAVSPLRNGRTSPPPPRRPSGELVNVDGIEEFLTGTSGTSKGTAGGKKKGKGKGKSSGGKSSSKATSRGKKGNSRDNLIDAFSDEDSDTSLTEGQIPIVQRAHQTGESPDDWRSRFERTGPGVDSDTESEVDALLMGDD